ncbi:UNVERIFIED_CONTAM: hypothetical protein K2H54_007885 [Gekko kuhli]
MSADKEIIIPVTTEETPVTTGGMTPTTMGLDATPSVEGAGDSGMVPKYLGRATARVTTRTSGLSWGRLSADTQETWSLTTPMHHRGSRYESSGGVEVIQEDSRPGLASPNLTYDIQEKGDTADLEEESIP